MTPSPFLAALFSLLWVSGPAIGAEPQAASARAAALGGDFELPDADGKPFRLADQRGKVVLVYFGYTGCPDACPTDLLLYRDLLARLGERREKLLTVFISVDPARDTPRQLIEYARGFSPEIIALTGKEKQLRHVARAYGAHFRYVGRESDAKNYTVDHSVSIYMVDPRGRLVGVIPFGTPLAEVQRRVEAVMAAAPAPSARSHTSNPH